MPKLINLGCKLNQYEGFCLLEKFSHVENLIVVNTCCVTKEAEVKSQKKLRQAIRKYPGATIVATGCACQIHPEKFTPAQYIINNIARHSLIKDVKPQPNKARYFLKIQDGCNMSCTYCIVPKVRPRVESKPIKDIEWEILRARGLGYKEIVLVGANIGLYGQDRNQRLDDLIFSMARIDDCPRLRLSSTEPLFITAQLISLLKELPLCHHFHIPIQSADNNVLQAMKRGYDNTYLSQIFDLIRKSFPDVAIGADIIVGFPGEGKKEFTNTYQFLSDNPCTHLHVFPYSPRPGTEASALGDPVAHSEKKERLWALKELIKKKNHEFRQRLLHKKFWAIIERTNGKCVGLTDNYLRVEIDQPCQQNELVEVMITGVTTNTTYATQCNREVPNF